MSERRLVVISIEGDAFIASIVENHVMTVLIHGHLNSVNHDCEIVRGKFPPLPEETEVRVIARPGSTWSGRLVYFGQTSFCPRCDIDPKDCGEHA